MKQIKLILVLIISICQFGYGQQTTKAGNVKMTKNEIMKRAYENGRARRPHLNTAEKQAGRVRPAPAANKTGNCSCDIPLDGSFSYVVFDGDSGGIFCSGCPGFPPDYRNDDSYTSTPVNLPFTFCFYGTSYNKVYISNNGNISFNDFYEDFSSSPFPSDTEMIAPFWADVDTRGAGSGVVYYKVTPTALIVKWDSVGYFDSYDDLLNTFQLIITDGTDPLVPNGNNVSFCYKDMQWTTGDASDGFGGFGGDPATVGANKGDGIHYIQFGTFDQTGNVYNGPYGNPSGIDWLDNKVFNFNVCTGGNNIPPSPSGIATCDTIRMCINDVLNLPSQFFSPETGQTTTVVITTSPGLLGWTVFSNIPGNPAMISAQLIANAANSGFYTITFTATDNGIPAATTITKLIVFINDPKACGNTLYSSFISSDTTFCNEGGQCIDFTDRSTGNPTSWKWLFPGALPDTSTAQNPTGICYFTPGTYAVTLIVSNSGGSDTLMVSPMITFGSGAALPSLNLIGDTIFCSHASGYQWYFNGSPISGATDSFYVAAIYGNYSVQITDGLGCTRLSDGVFASVKELNGEGGIKVYPNPVTDELTIYTGGLLRSSLPRNDVIASEAKQSPDLIICNVLGENVYSGFLHSKQETINPPKDGSAVVDCKQFSAGIYIVELSNGDKVYRAKFVKQ